MSFSKNILLLLCSISFSFIASGQQTRFSLSTDVAVLRSFKKDQAFWAIGQTVQGNFHFTPTDGAYVWFSYYTNGKFFNMVTATAKSPATTPQEIHFRNDALLGIKHFSIGWKRYFIGTIDAEKKWNLYGLAGFGLMLGSVQNTYTTVLDPNSYNIPVYNGRGQFKRLTFDIGAGFEKPVGGDVFIYGEARALVPASDYPSKYLFINNNAPLTGTANLGIRILF